MAKKKSSNRLVLDYSSVAHDFFKGQKLLGVVAGRMSMYRFCWQLNHYLNLNLQRRPDMDVDVPWSSFGSKQEAKAPSDLFSNMEAVLSNKERVLYFPVYQQDIGGTEFNLTLYGNLVEGQVLLEELPAIDFIALVPDNPSLEEPKRFEQCLQLESVTQLIEIELGKLKNKDRLLF